MSYVVTLTDYVPGAREDGIPWTQAQIAEAMTSNGPWTTIDTQTFDDPDGDPSSPKPRSFTTTLAELPSGWYLVTFLDGDGAQQPTVPVPYPPPAPQATLPYCSVLDVQSRNAARPVTPSSTPNLGQVQQFVCDAAAELNAILINKGYQVPVVSASNPSAFAVLHSINVTGAWAMMEQASPNSPNIDRAQTAWTAAKKMLSDSDFTMNAPQDVERAEPRGPWQTLTPTSETYDPMFSATHVGTGPRNNPRNPYFSRTQQFLWEPGEWDDVKCHSRN